jgi:hypothetical protein
MLYVLLDVDRSRVGAVSARSKKTFDTVKVFDLHKYTGLLVFPQTKAPHRWGSRRFVISLLVSIIRRYFLIFKRGRQSRLRCRVR